MNKIIKFVVNHKLFFVGFSIGFMIPEIRGNSSIVLIPLIFLVIYIGLYFIEKATSPNSDFMENL